MRLTRRSLLATAASAPLLLAQNGKKIPIGLELYSVRKELKEDLEGTVKAVAKMGYDGVEFFAPYFDWTPGRAKEVRKLLDDLNIRCFSTHNGPNAFTETGVQHAIELNTILGSGFVVMASAGRITTLDDWKKVADTLNTATTHLKPAALRAGYHNHQLEFKPLDGTRPMEILARNTDKSVMLQLDVGTCIEAGSDPVAWIDENPGRIRSLHCKDWAPGPDKGYKVLFGEGVAPWPKIFQAARKTGGLEYVLIEQEGSAYPALETAERCLKTIRAMHI